MMPPAKWLAGVVHISYLSRIELRSNMILTKVVGSLTFMVRIGMIMHSAWCWINLITIIISLANGRRKGHLVGETEERIATEDKWTPAWDTLSFFFPLFFDYHYLWDGCGQLWQCNSFFRSAIRWLFWSSSSSHRIHFGISEAESEQSWYVATGQNSGEKGMAEKYFFSQ